MSATLHAYNDKVVRVGGLPVRLESCIRALDGAKTLTPDRSDIHHVRLHFSRILSTQRWHLSIPTVASLNTNGCVSQYQRWRLSNTFQTKRGFRRAPERPSLITEPDLHCLGLRTHPHVTSVTLPILIERSIKNVGNNGHRGG